MKQALIGFGMFMILILTVGCVMAVEKDSIELQKLEAAVEIVVYQSLNEAIQSQDNPGDIFEESLIAMIGDDVDITIMAADSLKGILSVSVEKRYSNFGKERSVYTERTVIYEREI